VPVLAEATVVGCEKPEGGEARESTWPTVSRPKDSRGGQVQLSALLNSVETTTQIGVIAGDLLRVFGVDAGTDVHKSVRKFL
jgi:hypothetical protein